MKKLLYVSIIFAAGCASQATRHVSSAAPAGQKFTCNPDDARGGALQLWVNGNEAAMQRPGEQRVEHYHLSDDRFGVGTTSGSGKTKHNLFVRLVKECPANYDCGSLQIDLRMQDGSWTKDAGPRGVNPELYFSVEEGHSAQSDDNADDIFRYNCTPAN